MKPKWINIKPWAPRLRSQALPAAPVAKFIAFLPAAQMVKWLPPSNSPVMKSSMILVGS